ncbi:MAG: phenylacetate--CoA ligase family protein [Desulfobacter sp.]|nr:MAG: phenylacetate--CoA ligase family protein [Desulfobacter sp.]
MIPAFLDRWIYDATGPGPASPGDRLAAYQLDCLNRSLAHARSSSRFYRDRLSGAAPLTGLKDMAALPLTRPGHIRKSPKSFLAVSQDEISRIATLATSGTTAAPKRLFFTGRDLDRTLDFFKAVLAPLMAPGDTGLIFLPGSTRASAGDLIKTAMEALGARPRVPGIITDFKPAADLVEQTGPALIIGMPVQILALGEYMKSTGSLTTRIPWAILTADHLPAALAGRVEALLGGKVLNHYGMTETGFGGAIQCPAREGLHLRLPDLFFEIIDPATGAQLPPGVWGEVAVTTLNRRGMPLIRYRTGDVSRIIDTPCACGSPYPRLDRIRNRQAESADSAGVPLTMADLDDILFSLPGVVDFSARISKGKNIQVNNGANNWTTNPINNRTNKDTGPKRGTPVLDIELMGLAPLPRNIDIDPDRSPGLKTAIESGRLRMGRITTRKFDFRNTYVGKRQILYNE